jgi:hypothetical protein
MWFHFGVFSQIAGFIGTAYFHVKKMPEALEYNILVCAACFSHSVVIANVSGIVTLAQNYANYPVPRTEPITNIGACAHMMGRFEQVCHAYCQQPFRHNERWCCGDASNRQRTCTSVLLLCNRTS